MPPGFQTRIAPQYLAEVYRYPSAAAYAQQWIQSHELQKNVPAQEMVSLMEAIDDAVIREEHDVINSLSFEKLVRRAYGLEKAFEDVQREEDWRRPDGKKLWQSKVKWDLCDRYDLRNANKLGTRIADADEEAKRAMERDAAFHKWYSKAHEAQKKTQAE